MKHSYCVEALYSIIPAPMKVFFTKEVVGNIVQDVFNYMAEFATQQLDKVAEQAGIAKKDE